MLLIHEDTSTHSTEPIFPTSALHKCFHPCISLALTSSSCFLFQRGGCGVFCCCCYLLGFFCLHVGVCDCFMGSPSHSAGLQSLSQVSTFLGGGQIMATEVKVVCSKDHLFSWVWKKTLLLLTSSGPTLCSRHLYSHENCNVTGINSTKWQQLIPLQLPAPAGIKTETSN